MPVHDALEEVWEVWKETGSEKDAMAAITKAWTDNQDNLKTLRTLHPGALGYFVEIKNLMLKAFRSGVPPKGCPRPRSASLPINRMS